MANNIISGKIAIIPNPELRPMLLYSLDLTRIKGDLR